MVANATTGIIHLEKPSHGQHLLNRLHSFVHQIEEGEGNMHQSMTSPTDLAAAAAESSGGGSEQVPTSQPEPETHETSTPHEYSRSSIKTAKKVLTAITKQRKAEAAKEPKVETLQLKKKEKPGPKAKKADESQE